MHHAKYGKLWHNEREFEASSQNAKWYCRFEFQITMDLKYSQKRHKP